MPSMSSLLSGAVSFGVLAGVLTGICYVLVSGLRWAGLLRSALGTSRPAATLPADHKTCARCGRRLSVLSLGPSRRLHCAHCRLLVCRHCCTRTTNTKWLCVSCRKLRDVQLQSGEWFYQQLRQRFRSTVAALGNSDKNDGEVQEFMEKLVETMIGGGLDDVPLHPLSDRPEYANFCALYKDPLVHILRRLYVNLKMALSDSALQDGETASDLHSELKELLKQIIHEALTQQQLMEHNGQTSWPSAAESPPDSLGQRSYEDILATAILNKIFAKYHQDRPRRKGRSNKKAFDKNSNLLSEKLMGDMQGELPESESEDSDSVANSIDSWSESSHHEPLSVTIEECIEEVTTRYSSDDEEEPKSDIDRFLSSLKYIKRQRAPFPELGKDIVDGGASSLDNSEEDDHIDNDKTKDEDELNPVELVNPVDSWEENWLFQRRRLKSNMGTCQPVPVPMLVPNPSEDFRAMIGDVDADEMSDLSDCSDSVLEDLVDGTEDYSQHEQESEGEKVLDKQREMFLQYISNEVSKRIEPLEELRGMSPATDTGQSETVEAALDTQVVEMISSGESSGKDPTVSSPEATDSSHSYSVAEARNLTVPVLQVDSGEGSLDMQQDSEYTVAYAAVAQVRSTSKGPSPALSPASSPVPKPRTVLTTTTPSEVPSQEKSDEECNSLSELSLPPKPGTIAEREHLKWEKAPPLANNPYSKENITRRQRQRMYLSRHSSSENSIEFPELTGTKEPSLMEIDIKHRRDDCNKYVRDYYVNVAEGREGQKHPVPPRPMSAEPRSAALTNSCSPQQQVSVRVEVEVAVSKACSTSNQTTAHHHQVTTLTSPKEDDAYISLPSVKELAKQFSSPDEKIPNPTSPIPARKQSEVKLHSPVRQVHSLTARNISREFRENLRSTKSTTVPVVKVAIDKDLDSSGHVSEDSGTVSPTPCPPPRRLKLKDDIEFWEQLKQQR